VTSCCVEPISGVLDSKACYFDLTSSSPDSAGVECRTSQQYSARPTATYNTDQQKVRVDFGRIKIIFRILSKLLFIELWKNAGKLQYRPRAKEQQRPCKILKNDENAKSGFAKQFH